MKVSLLVLTEGKASGKAIPITLSQFLIGRDPQCHLRPASAVISKRHCAILIKNGKVLVRDFDSTNGTFVNEEPVKGQREVHHDDQLRVGPLTFRISIESTAPVNKPTPPPPKPAEANAEDDSVAAMLLALQDDAAGPSSGIKDADGIPDGSTVMDIPPVAPGDTDETQTPKEVEALKPQQKKPEPAKQEGANTSSAARAILEKYTRRPRG
jgi:predicted component of type VI protein secretion system